MRRSHKLSWNGVWTSVYGLQMVQTLLIDCRYILTQFLKIIESSSYEGDQGL